MLSVMVHRIGVAKVVSECTRVPYVWWHEWFKTSLIILFSDNSQEKVERLDKLRFCFGLKLVLLVRPKNIGYLQMEEVSKKKKNTLTVSPYKGEGVMGSPFTRQNGTRLHTRDGHTSHLSRLKYRGVPVSYSSLLSRIRTNRIKNNQRFQRILPLVSTHQD